LIQYVLSISMKKEGYPYGFWDGKYHHDPEFSVEFPGALENPHEEGVKIYKTLFWAEKAKENFTKKLQHYDAKIVAIEADHILKERFLKEINK